MKWLFNFCRQHKYALIWTVCYVFAMWSILYYLFNFDMFIRANWIRLAHAQLTGFAGFVFGILILAALPIYIATTSIIIRTKKPLITIPTPWFLRESENNKTPATAPTPSATPTSTTPSATPSDDAPPHSFPSNMPNEIKPAFIRARQHIGPAQTSRFNATNMTTPPTPAAEPVPVMQSANDIPLPSDFDIEPEFTEFSDAPVFSDITFDSSPDSPAAPITATPKFTDFDIDAPTPATDTAPSIADEFRAHGHNIIRIDNNIIITDRHAIATHDDPDFWIADDESWFAAGQQKQSPVAAAQIAAGDNLTPVLYLKSTNIMDIDTRRAKWESDGIVVITDASAL